MVTVGSLSELPLGFHFVVGTFTYLSASSGGNILVLLPRIKSISQKFVVLLHLTW